MKRSDIRGWTWRIRAASIEVVTYKHFPVCIAIWNHNMLVNRLEVS